MPYVPATDLERGHLIREGSSWTRVLTDPQEASAGQVSLHTNRGGRLLRADEQVFVTSTEPKVLPLSGSSFPPRVLT